MVTLHACSDFSLSKDLPTFQEVFSNLSTLCFKHLNGSFINSTIFVDQMASHGGPNIYDQ